MEGVVSVTPRNNHDGVTAGKTQSKFKEKLCSAAAMFLEEDTDVTVQVF